MRRVLRIALMWLLALALPVQGVVAATMVACGPGHSSVAVQADTGHHPVQVDHSHHRNAAAHDDLTEVKSDVVKVVSQKCSACASCCTAAMLPSPAPSLVSAVVPEFFVAAVPADTALFLTDGPERPPRILFD